MELPSINSHLSVIMNIFCYVVAGWLIEWLERSPNIQASGVRIHEKGQLLFFFHCFPFFSFFFIGI